jgi:hypothetical protein
VIKITVRVQLCVCGLALPKHAAVSIERTGA